MGLSPCPPRRVVGGAIHAARRHRICARFIFALVGYFLARVITWFLTVEVPIAGWG